jgi:putative ubiquitin-RnfH superfamily antitoxin RatB of RatAB toxin-antitoxin module
MALRTKASSALQTTENVSGNYLLPDEDFEEFRRFSDAILQELAPQGAYQSHLAANIVHIEWDQQRHRRLLAAVLQTEFRALAAGVAEMGVPGRASALFSVRSHFDLGRSLLAHEAQGEEVLRKAGVTRSEITAAALLARRETVAYHEARIGDLERRRRQLLEDYDRYRARKPLVDDPDDAIEVI